MGEVQTYHALPCWKTSLSMGGVLFRNRRVALRECEGCMPYPSGDCIGASSRDSTPVEVMVEEGNMSGKCPLVPQDDKIVFVLVKLSETTEGGVIVPSKMRDDQLVGRVVAVGPWNKKIRAEQEVMKVEVGDLVLFGRAVESTLLLGTTEYNVCALHNVLCKLEGVEALELQEVED